MRGHFLQVICTWSSGHIRREEDKAVTCDPIGAAVSSFQPGLAWSTLWEQYKLPSDTEG